MRVERKDTLYDIYFYADTDGVEPVTEFIKDLQQQNGKDARIRANKVNDYIQILSLFGKAAGEPYIKHLDGDIWELRPTRDRVLFAGWTDNGFVLLHHFMKKTQKTPKREIEQAKRELADWIERGGADES